ncbi:MAG: DUF2628 domain-containing protein [Hyphomicrobiales bacterium]|nr:MAG: DUF2628 domain-containing protein [Hyphomicrobiales bacterium]
MASYVVMEPPAGAGEAKDKAVLVRDGFHLLAFLVPALWLLFHRLWIEALLVVAVSMALAGAGSVAGLGNAAPALSLLVALYVGLEGPALRLAAFRRRGWRDWGVVEADNAGDAEIRYLAEADEEEDAREEAVWPAAAAAPVAPPRPPVGPALGLFSYPGRG